MKKKVLIITATLNFGGAERVIVDTAKALARNKDYHPIICSLLGDGEMREELEEAKIEYRLLNLKNIKNIISNFITVRRLIKNCRPDIIHTHQLASDFYGSVGAIGLNIPVVSHIHTPDIPQPLSKKIIRFLISFLLIDAFIATIEEGAILLKKFIPSVKNVYILHNAIDPKNFSLPEGFNKKIYRNKLSIPENTFVIGSVGRMAWEKGYDYLLEAFKQTLKEIADSFLVLVGDGPDIIKLKKLAQDLNISDKVMFTGYRKDVAALVSSFDIFVVSSKIEAFSLVTFEAIHLGIPVIITDRLSSKELLSRKTLIVPCSVNGLKTGIISLFKNEKLRAEMSIEGKEMIKNEFTIETYIKKLEKIYDAVLKNFTS